MSMSFYIICYTFFMIIAQRIKELRLEKEYTQKTLARLVFCDQSMIARWEKEECEPTASAIVKLSSALDCSCDYLLGKSEE